MTTSDDETALFDPDDVDAAAAAHDVASEQLTSLAERHQSSIQSLPGVENLAYEWRKQYESPLIERTQSAYYLDVPEWVWQEFGEALDTSEALLNALEDLHRRTVVAQTEAMSEPPGRQTYVALDRTLG